MAASMNGAEGEPASSSVLATWLKQSLAEERKAIDLVLRERHEILLASINAKVETVSTEEPSTEQQGPKTDMATIVVDVAPQQVSDASNFCIPSEGKLALDPECTKRTWKIGLNLLDVDLQHISGPRDGCEGPGDTLEGADEANAHVPPEENELSHSAPAPINWCAGANGQEVDRQQTTSPFCSGGESDPEDTPCAVHSEPLSPSRLESSMSLHSKREPSRTTVLRSSLREAAEAQERDSKHWWELVVLGPTFELAFAFLILANTAVMALEAQYNGLDLGYEIGSPGYTRPAAQAWPHSATFFLISEWFFGVLFTVEVTLKLAAQRWKFFSSLWNFLDTFIIIFWCIGVLDAVQLGGNPFLLRLVRMFRLLRLLRLARALQAFDVLHVLISSLRASVYAMMWSLTLLLLIMLMGALVLHSIVADRLRIGAFEGDAEIAMFQYFGSFSRGMLSMFELTLGNWVPITRFLNENLHEAIGPILLIYQCLVSFAVIRVITGVFLHETFKVASSDDELMIMQKNRQIAKHVEKMQQLFAEADESGDGYLNLAEFTEVMNDTRVKAWLAAMELDVRDAETMFALVDDGDRRVSAYELVAGFARLKGGAKSLDMNTLLKQCTRIEELLVEIASGGVAQEVLEERRNQVNKIMQRQLSRFAMTI